MRRLRPSFLRRRGIARRNLVTGVDSSIQRCDDETEDLCVLDKNIDFKENGSSWDYEGLSGSSRAEDSPTKYRNRLSLGNIFIESVLKLLRLIFSFL